MEKKLHFLESFTAQGSDGKEYKVCGYEHLVRDETAVDGIEHWEPTGVFEYRLDDGRRVDAKPDGSMRIADSDTSLKAADRVAR